MENFFIESVLALICVIMGVDFDTQVVDVDAGVWVYPCIIDGALEGAARKAARNANRTKLNRRADGAKTRAGNMTRKDFAVRSAQKSAYAALKADRRQSVGGLLAGELFDIEITYAPVCDPEYGYDDSERTVLVPVDLAGDAASIHKLCDHDGYGHDVEIKVINGVQLENWTVVLTNFNMSVGIVGDIVDDTNAAAVSGYWEKRFTAYSGWAIKSLLDYQAWSYDIEAAISSFKYYGCLLDKLYYQLAEGVGTEAAHGVVVGLYDLLTRLYGDRANWPRLQLGTLQYLHCRASSNYDLDALLSFDTYAHSLIGYVHGLGIQDSELPEATLDFYSLDQAGFPVTKALALEQLGRFRGTDSQLAKMEEAASYRHIAAGWTTQVIAYPTTDLAWLVASGQFCEKNAIMPAEYSDNLYTKYQVCANLAAGHARKAKLTAICSAFNPFMTFAALGLAKHLPAGLFVSMRAVRALHDLNMLIVKGLVKVDKSLKISENNDSNSAAVIAKIQMSHYLGAAAGSLDDQRAIYLADHIDWKVDDEYSSAVAMPEKFKKQVATTWQLQTIIFDHKLEIDWSLGNSPKTAIVNTLLANGVAKDTAEQYLVTPDVQAAMAFAMRNNNSNVVCELPEVVAEHDKFVMEKLAKTDIRNLYIGELTSCCQKLGGAGHAVCVESWTDTKSANYVFRQGNTILGHMWVFKTACGGYMIDSIEGRSQITAAVVIPLIQEFVQAVGAPVYLSATNYGVTSQVKQIIETLPVQRSTVKSVVEYSYMDYDGTNCVQVVA